MAFTLPRIPANLVSPDFQIWWQQVVEAIEEKEGAQDAAIAIAEARAAADAANTAATVATAAASAAQDTADNITSASALASSYVSGLTLTATDAGADATISISAHTRHYPQPDGSTIDVAVSGGTLTGQAYDTLFYIYYDDPTRAGGAVTYHSTASSSTAAQIGDRHTVGAVKTPISGGAAANGDGTDPPGPGSIKAASI